MTVNLGPAKGKDFAGTLGPWIVTADELDRYRDADGFLDLWCTAAVNGVEVGRDLLSNMGWTFETMIAYAAGTAGWWPATCSARGTVGNGGCLAELWGRRRPAGPAAAARRRRGHADRAGIGTHQQPGPRPGAPRPAPTPRARRGTRWPVNRLSVGRGGHRRRDPASVPRVAARLHRRGSAEGRRRSTSADEPPFDVADGRLATRGLGASGDAVHGW
jgi:hypothetical protein